MWLLHAIPALAPFNFKRQAIHHPIFFFRPWGDKNFWKCWIWKRDVLESDYHQRISGNSTEHQHDSQSCHNTTLFVFPFAQILHHTFPFQTICHVWTIRESVIFVRSCLAAANRSPVLQKKLKHVGIGNRKILKPQKCHVVFVDLLKKLQKSLPMPFF